MVDLLLVHQRVYRAISIVNCCDVAPKEGIASLPVSAQRWWFGIRPVPLFVPAYFRWPRHCSCPNPSRFHPYFTSIYRAIGLYQLEETCPGRDAFRTIYINLSKSTTFSQVHWLLSKDMPRQSLGPPHFQTQHMGHSGHNMISFWMP